MKVAGGAAIPAAGRDGTGGGDIEWRWSGCPCRSPSRKAGTGFLWAPGGGRGGRGGGAEDHCKLFAESTGCDDAPSDVSGKGEGDCEGILVDGPGS